MLARRSVFRRWLLLPAVLVCLHSALVGFIAIAVATSSDSEAVMGWILPYYLDLPSSLLIARFNIASDSDIPVRFFVIGLFHWGIIGLLIQFAWRWFIGRGTLTEAGEVFTQRLEHLRLLTFAEVMTLPEQHKQVELTEKGEMTVTTYRDLLPDGRVRIVVQRHHRLVLGMGKIMAHGFIITPDGTRTPVPQEMIQELL